MVFDQLYRNPYLMKLDNFSSNLLHFGTHTSNNKTEQTFISAPSGTTLKPSSKKDEDKRTTSIVTLYYSVSWTVLLKVYYSVGHCHSVKPPEK